jgi:hypothetical protein
MLAIFPHMVCDVSKYSYFHGGPVFESGDLTTQC